MSNSVEISLSDKPFPVYLLTVANSEWEILIYFYLISIDTIVYRENKRDYKI